MAARRRSEFLGRITIVAASVVFVIGCGSSEESKPRARVDSPMPDRVVTEKPIGIDPAEEWRAGEERAENGLGMPFRYCPPGSFLMGALDETGRGLPGAEPVPVTISRGFWMGQYEVTQRQWSELMGRDLRAQRAQDPRQPRPVGDGSMRDHVGEGPDHPIYYVSHDEAEEFCRAFTQLERDASRLPEGWAYRLPTEAQWEYACRAGTNSATAFGDSLDSSRANFDGRWPFNGAPEGPFLRETTSVGRYEPNAWGLSDMLGNVCEWCRDSYSSTLAGGNDPEVLDPGPSRVFRGGSWDLRGFQCLSATRSHGPTDARGSGLGFRVALVPEGR